MIRWLRRFLGGECTHKWVKPADSQWIKTDAVLVTEIYVGTSPPGIEPGKLYRCAWCDAVYTAQLVSEAVPASEETP
jgi:hypothetical protein